MGKKSRTKGRALEQEVVRILKAVFPDACRNLQQWARSDGRDIDDTPGWCIQVKGGKRPPWERGYTEAAETAEDDEVALCVTRKDRGEWMAHLRLSDLVALLEGTETRQGEAPRLLVDVEEVL